MSANPPVKPGVTQISRVSIDVVRNVQHTLLTDHWEEVARNKRVMVLDPDWPAYYRLEEQKLLITLVAWQGVADAGSVVGKLVGYSVNIIVPKHLHYRGLSVLQNDVLYVDPKSRGRSVGARLIKATVEAGREVGARMMLWHSKETDSKGKPAELGPLLLKMGYGVQDVIYSAEI